MRLALSLNDICHLIVNKVAPGSVFNAHLTTPPEGLTDANAEILVIDIDRPQKNPPPPQVTVRSTPG